MVLVQSALDAYAATLGHVPLKPSRADGTTLSSLLRTEYSLHTTEAGIRFVRAQRQGRALLVISSTGIPLNIWLRLLSDRDSGQRILIVQSRAGPLVEGGTPRNSSLYQDVEDIKEVLEKEQVFEIDILAWCNGARVALELASSATALVRSLTLLSPTFHGAVDARQYPSPFEDNLAGVYRILNQDPRRGQYLLRCLMQITPMGDLPACRNDPEKRATTVLNLPPHEFAQELYLPLSTVENFHHYIERVSSDESYDVAPAISRINCPILLLTGTHDAAISTRAARDVLAQHGRDVLSVTVLGAGHHIHLLQYAYFRYVLDCFLARSVPKKSARLQIERLAG
jgi:pimeloyl-ACP methyl ester carboxylesterase